MHHRFAPNSKIPPLKVRQPHTSDYYLQHNHASRCSISLAELAKTSSSIFFNPIPIPSNPTKSLQLRTYAKSPTTSWTLSQLPSLRPARLHTTRPRRPHASLGELSQPSPATAANQPPSLSLSPAEKSRPRTLDPEVASSLPSSAHNIRVCANVFRFSLR